MRVLRTKITLQVRKGAGREEGCECWGGGTQPVQDKAVANYRVEQTSSSPIGHNSPRCIYQGCGKDKPSSIGDNCREGVEAVHAKNWRIPTSSKCKWAIVLANLNAKHFVNWHFIARKMTQIPPFPPSSSVYAILRSIAI